MNKIAYTLLCFLLSVQLSAQNNLSFEGQASVLSSFAPDNELNCFIGARYIPKLSYRINNKEKEDRFFDFEASIYTASSLHFRPFEQFEQQNSLDAYRLWARYNNEQLEVRLGLQKIDFGSAKILRPLQWFNQIDVRDPLQLTNGVYGLLGRYYFLNNSNIWLWALYGNNKRRGFDLLESHKKRVEVGGRLQQPIPKGELALSYHYRTAQAQNLHLIPNTASIPEHKVGIDAKWDIKVGLWLEASYSHSAKNIEQWSNQSLINIGIDYTFSWGNGVMLSAEHLMVDYHQDLFHYSGMSHITALMSSYPLGFFDQLSAVYYLNWEANQSSFSINYQHDFKQITTYLMAFYNPKQNAGIVQNDFINQFAGAGLRLMLVYQH